tara:strand:+ start:332 stop:595 length:264 start_codon:yes stop_codon:yes gene_type:complete
MIKPLSVLVLLILICVIPVLDNKNKFRIEMLTNGFLNKFILLGLAFYITTIDSKIGIFSFVLVFSLIYTGSTNVEITEGFKNYFNKN